MQPGHASGTQGTKVKFVGFISISTAKVVSAQSRIQIKDHVSEIATSMDAEAVKLFIQWVQ